MNSEPKPQPNTDFPPTRPTTFPPAPGDAPGTRPRPTDPKPMPPQPAPSRPVDPHA